MNNLTCCNSYKRSRKVLLILGVFLLIGLTGFAQAPGTGFRPLRDRVSPPVPGAGQITHVSNFREYTTVQLAQSTPRFFEMFPVPQPQLPVQTWDIRFTSTDFDGTPVTIHAQLFVPVLGGARGNMDNQLPLYVFASGTTGISNESAPSLEQPEVERWGWYRENMLAYASQGYIVIFPDYTGFHDPNRIQRYFSKLAEGYMMLDAIRAAFNFFSRPEARNLRLRPSQAVFTAGYSQGGHAAMAAADLRPYYAPEVPLTGVITYGSTNDVEALMREGVAYTPLILYAYREMYGPELVRIEDVLQARWLPNFDREAQFRLPQFQAHFGFQQAPVFTPAFRNALNNRTMRRDFPSLYYLMAENHTGHTGHGLPALVIQGSLDFIVTDATQTIFVERLRELGSEVDFRIFPGVSHRYTRHAGFQPSLDWMAEQIRRMQ